MDPRMVAAAASSDRVDPSVGQSLVVVGKGMLLGDACGEGWVRVLQGTDHLDVGEAEGMADEVENGLDEDVLSMKEGYDDD